MLEQAAAAGAPAGSADDCVSALKRERARRDLVRVQRDIDRLQEGARLDDDALAALWERKKELLRQLEDLTVGNA
jgi:hypothetical protein